MSETLFPSTIRLSAFADEISADPREQVEVLQRHGIRFIEFRSIHKYERAGFDGFTA